MSVEKTEKDCSSEDCSTNTKECLESCSSECTISDCAKKELKNEHRTKLICTAKKLMFLKSALNEKNAMVDSALEQIDKEGQTCKAEMLFMCPMLNEMALRCRNVCFKSLDCSKKDCSK